MAKIPELAPDRRLSQREGFALLVKGTPLSVEDVEKRAMDKDRYLDAGQALEAGLVEGVI